MKTYVCHKTVQAAKIISVVYPKPGDRDEIVLEFDNGEHECVSWDWCETKMGEPRVDMGYFVKYADGYTSWSPTKAFEDGYTEVKI